MKSGKIIQFLFAKRKLLQRLLRPYFHIISKKSGNQRFPHLDSGSDLISRAVSSQVPSALRGLTAVFGMGTGGSLLPLPPEMVCFLLPRAPRFFSSAPFQGLPLPARPSAHLQNHTTLPARRSPFDLDLSSSTPFGLFLSLLDQALDRLVPTTSIHCCTSSVGLSPHRL